MPISVRRRETAYACDAVQAESREQQREHTEESGKQQQLRIGARQQPSRLRATCGTRLRRHEPQQVLH
jgi:hypothetical protein